MISGAKHYLEFELKEPQIDADVDALTGEEPHEGEPIMEAFKSYIDFVRNKWNSIKNEFEKEADAKGLDFNVYYYDNRAPFPSIWPGGKNYGPADSRGISFPDPNKNQNLIPNFNSVLQSIGVNDLVAKPSKTYPAILMPKFPLPKSFMLEGEIGKDEELSARLYKIKKAVQPAFYQKVRMMINNGDLEKAEEFIKRMEPMAAKQDIIFNKMKGELDALEEGLPKGFWDKKMKAKDETNESYETLKKKIQSQGKSAKAAGAIAGAIAAYKAKGGGKGPTAKQSK